MSSERPRGRRGKGERGGSRKADPAKAASEGASKGKGTRKSAPGKPKRPRRAGDSAAREGRAKKGSPDKRASGGTRERSAGGVLVHEGQVVVIVPTRRSSDGSKVLALPKGHIDPGETPLQAAVREVREETGIVGEPVTELGETRYWYRRGGRTIPKSVSFYLFDFVEGDTSDHDDEVEEARWIELEQATRELSHAAEREMVARAIVYLEAERKDR